MHRDFLRIAATVAYSQNHSSSWRDPTPGKLRSDRPDFRLARSIGEKLHGWFLDRLGQAIVLLIRAGAFIGASNRTRPTVAPEPVEPLQQAAKAQCCADCCPECLACCAEDGCCPECILCCIAMACDPSCCFPSSTSAKAEAGSTKSVASAAKASKLPMAAAGTRGTSHNPGWVRFRRESGARR